MLEMRRAPLADKPALRHSPHLVSTGGLISDMLIPELFCLYERLSCLNLLDDSVT